MPIRRLLAALTAAVILSVALGGTVLAAKPTKVQLCHFNTRTDSWTLISVMEKKVGAHLAHGDGFPGEAVPGGGGATFDDQCGISGEATAFAIAWMDSNANHTYEPDTDVLISKLVDANLNGTLDAGDGVVTAAYPLDFVPESSSEFTVTTHTVDQVLVLAGRIAAFDAEGNLYNWETPEAGLQHERYEERVADVSLVAIIDGNLASEGDRILIDDTAPSAPAIERDLSQTNDTNDAFIDVFILPGG